MKTVYISLFRNAPMTSDFEVVSETEKAYQLQNNESKTMWVPKKGLEKVKFSGEKDFAKDTYTIAKWFRGKLENWQIAFLQG